MAAVEFVYLASLKDDPSELQISTSSNDVLCQWLPFSDLKKMSFSENLLDSETKRTIDAISKGWFETVLSINLSPGSEYRKLEPGHWVMKSGINEVKFCKMWSQI